jgi:hypothetical protein
MKVGLAAGQKGGKRMYFDGVWYPTINVLLILMQNAGPTIVAGLGGTTAALVGALSHGAVMARLR